MKRLSMFLIFASSLWADGWYYFDMDMCPGEQATVRLVLQNNTGKELRDVILADDITGDDFLRVAMEPPYIQTIPIGESRTFTFLFSADIEVPAGQTACVKLVITPKNGEVAPAGIQVTVNLLPGPGPANLLSATPLSSREINLVWEVTGNEGCCAGYYAAYKPEGQADFILDPELIVGATDYTLEVPYPSTEYELQIVTANYDGEPTELVSNSLFAITHPYLSSRTRDALDPSNSSKFTDKGDRVYLVHEDQDRVWLATGTNALGKIDWEEQRLQGANLRGLRTALRCHLSPCTARGYEFRLVPQALREAPSFSPGTTDLRQGYCLTQDREILYASWDEQTGG